MTSSVVQKNARMNDMGGLATMMKDIDKMGDDTIRNKSFNSRRISFSVPRIFKKKES